MRLTAITRKVNQFHFFPPFHMLLKTETKKSRNKREPREEKTTDVSANVSYVLTPQPIQKYEKKKRNIKTDFSALVLLFGQINKL